MRAGEVAARCGDSTFTATTRWRISSNAWKTISEPALTEHLEHLVVPDPAERIGPLRRGQERERNLVTRCAVGAEGAGVRGLGVVWGDRRVVKQAVGVGVGVE